MTQLLTHSSRFYLDLYDMLSIRQRRTERSVYVQLSTATPTWVSIAVVQHMRLLTPMPAPHGLPDELSSPLPISGLAAWLCDVVGYPRPLAALRLHAVKDLGTLLSGLPSNRHPPNQPASRGNPRKLLPVWSFKTPYGKNTAQIGLFC